MALETPGVDVYASQKANIRDTIKYMAAAYAACGTVIFAGASLSSLGTLPIIRLIAVISFGALALTCVLVGIRLIFQALIGDFVFASSLDSNAKAEVNKHKDDLLNDIEFDTFLAKLRASKSTVEKIRAEWEGLPATAGAQDYADVKARYEQAIETHGRYESIMARTLSFAHLFLLQECLKTLQTKIGWLTFGAIAFFGIAVLIVTSKPSEECAKCWLAPQLVRSW